MAEDGGGGRVAHPVVGVDAVDPVLTVLERVRRGGGRAGLGLGKVWHRRHRSVGRLVAAVLALALTTGMAGLLAPAQAATKKKVTFTVALLNEADSFNPFLGIEAESYEMWALTYDYMIHYSMKDMSPKPGLAT